MAGAEPGRALRREWRACRAEARAGRLPHARALLLVQRAAAAQRWRRLERWLPPLLRSGVGGGERQGSAIAIADWLHQQGRPREALLCLNQVSGERLDAPAWLLRGVVERALGLLADAQLSLSQALVLAAAELRATVAYQLGELQRSQGQFDQAASWFLASLALDPEHRFSHNSLQYTRFAAALLPRVISHYRALVERRPERALPRQLLAHYLLQAGQTAAAVDLCRQASRLDLGARAALLAPAATAPTGPDFVILGVAKGGTTALLSWLSQHPRLWCHPRKELHFFDLEYGLGQAWYHAQFPTFQPPTAILRGEATPTYFSHPLVPERLARALPRVRCLVLLRDPIQRSISWVEHLRRLEGLGEATETVLRRELTRLEALEPAELAATTARVGTGALQESCYDATLERWRALLPADRLLVLRSERLFAQPAGELARVLRFLGVEPAGRDHLQRWRALNVNPAPPPTLSAALHHDLQRFFRRHARQSLAAADHNAAQDP